MTYAGATFSHLPHINSNSLTKAADGLDDGGVGLLNLFFVDHPIAGSGSSTRTQAQGPGSDNRFAG